MAKLYGAQRMVLQAIQNIQEDSGDYIEDARLAQVTQIRLEDMRNWLFTLDTHDYVDVVLTTNGFSASITPKGRLVLGLLRPFPSTTAQAQASESARPRLKTGREKALVVGISDYPPPIPKLPAVANDVREIASLLASDKGEFPARNVKSLVEHEATRQAILDALEATFRDAQPDEAMFVYLAGHGAIVRDSYYFVAHDTKAGNLADTGVPLVTIRDGFDACPSQRLFLWLDFCHSGGILARDLEGAPNDQEVIERTLKVVKGQGRLIFAACTPAQYAYESGTHGLFTNALLRGLKGEAAHDGEVTVNSLYDFIDRRMGSDRQRPMMFGQMTGRVVLMHYA